MKKRIFSLLTITAFASIVFSGCEKKIDSLPMYGMGNAPVLKSSVATIADVATDSLKTTVTFSWTSPNNAAPSSKFVIQIDSAGKDFSKAQSFMLMDSLQQSFNARDFNNMVLGLGFEFNKTYRVDVRVVSSYANNNNVMYSNKVSLQVTPYKTPPKVMPPSTNELYLVGDASVSGWENPVSRAQYFTKIDSVNYEITTYFNPGKYYLILPVNGSWSTKFAVKDNTLSGLNMGGEFGYNDGVVKTYDANFPGPSDAGVYTLKLNFQSGTFTVTQVTKYGSLWVPGGYQGWAPATAPMINSTKNDGNYEGYVNVPAGTTDFAFKLTSLPAWNGTNYGDGGAGTLNTAGGNLNFPAAGYYKISASTVGSMNYTLLSTSWALIGSFAGSGWSNDVPMTFNASKNRWEGQVTFTTTDEFKFRANSDWSYNYGDNNADGTLEGGGANIKAPAAGTYNVYLYLGSGGYYTYSFQ